MKEYRPRTKENAIHNFIIMIIDSWTFGKMTEEEKKRCMDVLRYAELIGTYEQRSKQLNYLYNAFLQGLGYTGAFWRNTDTERPLF